MTVITISKECGTESEEVAALLGKKLGWEYIGDQLVARIARELHISKSEVEAFRQDAQSRLLRFVAGWLLIWSPSAPQCNIAAHLNQQRLMVFAVSGRPRPGHWAHSGAPLQTATAGGVRRPRPTGRKRNDGRGIASGTRLPQKYIALSKR